MIKCIVVDDEPLALEQLAKYMGRISDVELVGKCLGVDQAREAIKNENVDLMFLDIEMPDCSGVQFVEELGEKCPNVVFTTAWTQYAVDGFRLDAVDYVLKPVKFEDLEKAVEKVKRRLASKSGAPAKQEEEDMHIFVKWNGVVRKLAAADIHYIKGLGEYVQIKVEGEERVMTVLASMRGLEEQLEPSGFMRVHKSWMVNLKRMSEANRTFARVGGQEIPIGKKYQPAFLKYIKGKVTS